jgi:hypothetical protein
MRGTLQSGAEGVETHAVSAEQDDSIEAQDVEPNESMTAEGYDEAVEQGTPYHAEEEIVARSSADPVALTEIEEIPADEIALMEPGRDLRPDTITPSPDVTSSAVEAYDDIEEIAEQELAAEDLNGEELAAGSAPEANESAPAVPEEVASGESTDEAKQ